MAATNFKLLAAGAEFHSYAALKESISSWEKSNNVNFYTRNSRTIQSATKHALNRSFKPKLHNSCAAGVAFAKYSGYSEKFFDSLLILLNNNMAAVASPTPALNGSPKVVGEEIKLKGVGIEGDIRKWIQAFLENRRQRVAIRGVYSTWLDVWSGVPQGSLLGPVLFLIFINDLFDDIQSSGKLFADDAKIYRRVNSHDNKIVLQEDLCRLQEWSAKWLLKFNMEKCKVMHVGKNNANYNYYIDGFPLQTTTEEKDSGVYVTPDTSPTVHISKAADKANSMLGRIKRTFTCMDKEIFLALYTTLVRPLMEYAVQAWSPYKKKDINILEKVQRRATKLVPQLKEKPYNERLDALGLTTLQARRIRGDMIEVLMLNGEEDIDCSQFLQIEPRERYETRGHQWKLKKTRFRTTKRSNFFDARVVNKWNSLPENVVNSSSVNMFKNRYDRYIVENLRRGYSQEL
ncbi:uncharacterized protein LOC143025774 [Oratosquilla oratoria]|uniref:uncharacterized protein LOC143025774 n=1 Tax=Oratosquilla oratoria TaxID=337810 RepID=UPI003F75FB91